MRLPLLLLVGLLAASAAYADGAPAPAPSRHSRRKQPKPKPKPAPPTTDSRCTGDADCTLTHQADGECCPMLCQPRAVSKRAADAARAACPKTSSRSCPRLSCAPPRGTTVAACVEGKCVAKMQPLE